MPTSPQNRIHVTLTPDLKRALMDLYALTGQRPATIVRGLLVEAVPALQEMASAIRRAQEGAPREAVDQMLQHLEREVTAARQLGLELRQKRRRKRVP